MSSFIGLVGGVFREGFCGFGPPPPRFNFVYEHHVLK